MLDQPITVGSLLIINVTSILPIVLLLGRGVWYLSRMVHQHDQMWLWWNRRGVDRPIPYSNVPPPGVD